MLIQMEADVIVQAVGRVRPFTRPREVITFHVGDLPGVSYTRDFHTLSQAREFFGLPTPSAAEQLSRSEKIQRYRAQGHTHKRIANELGVSLSTVKRDLRGRGHSALS
jgi:hypothetical protein